MLKVLQSHKNELDESSLKVEGIQRAIEEIDPSVEKRTTKGDETLMELRRLGLIDRKKLGNTTVYLLCPDGQEALNTIEKIGGARYFFGLLYEKEKIFKQYMDMLQRRERLGDEEAFEISGMSKPKAGFIKTILKQCHFIAEFSQQGQKSIVRYVRSELKSIPELKRAIVENYDILLGNRLFVTIDELWNLLHVQFPTISEELFDNAIFDLANEHLGEIELLQGVSSPQAKLLFDKRSGTYFHYLKIPKQVLEEERTNG